MTSVSHLKEALAGFQVNFGELVPDWERLVDLKIRRDENVDGKTLDVWTMIFEKHAMIMFFYTGEDDLLAEGEPQFSDFRLKATFVRLPGEKNFEQAEERWWYKQMDGARAILPELNQMYPGNLG